MGFYAEKIFPWVLDVTEPREMAEQRKLSLRDVAGDVLEIGLGTGANLPYYPGRLTKLVAVEPVDGMQKRALKRARAFGRTVEWIRSEGEALPFDDRRFDVVVTTDVLCTVGDVGGVLREAFRVLKPGGRLHFLEHGIAREADLQKWQHLLNGLTKLVACGCQLVRDIESYVINSDFVIEEISHLVPFAGINALFTHIRGTAVKPA